MSEISPKIRYILNFYDGRSTNAAQAHKKAVLFMVKMCYRKERAKDRSKNTHVKDAPHSYWPITEKVDETIMTVKQNRYVSSYDTAKELDTHHQTFLNQLDAKG